MKPEQVRQQLIARHARRNGGADAPVSARVASGGGMSGVGKSLLGQAPAESRGSHDDDIFASISASYFMLRRGLAIIAFLLPIGLWMTAGPAHVQPSISAYYHFSLAQPAVYGAGTARNILVGVLWAIGAFLYFYKGYSWKEDAALNLAGIAAIGVAMFPMDWPPVEDATRSVTATIHYGSAVLFFLAIAYVCIFRSGDTLAIMDEGAARDRFQRIYRVLGVLMVACPLLVLLIHYLSGHPKHNYVVLLVELGGIWVFSAFWLVKSREIARIEG